MLHVHSYTILVLSLANLLKIPIKHLRKKGYIDTLSIYITTFAYNFNT